MFPLSSQKIAFTEWDVQPTGILHSGPAWHSVNW
jgi:hypothetical protein